MRLAPSEEQRRFAHVLHDMLTRADPAALSKAWAEGDTAPGRRLWATLGDTGVTGLLVPPGSGGAGGGADDLVVACEQLGRHAVPGPVAESIGAVPLLLGVDDERLSGIVAGRMIGSLVAAPWLPYALDGDSVDLVLVAEGDAVFLGRAGAVHRSMDPARRFADVECGALLGTGRPVRRALDLGVLACSAQLLGAGQALLDMSVGHARERTQFGRPIGSFQAVRHRLADVAVALGFARPLLYAAAAALNKETALNKEATLNKETALNKEATLNKETALNKEATLNKTVALHKTAALNKTAGNTAADTLGKPDEHNEPDGETAADLDVGRDVSAAKVACGQAALLAARTALQVHGAVGYTAEHQLGRYLTLVRALHLSWGTPDQHRLRVLASITGEPDSPIGGGASRNGGATAGDRTPQPVSRLGAASGADVAWPPGNSPDSAGAGIARTEKRRK
jgi:alkylation response protein AidB-like acyl-CoA dehydrogenase